MASIKVIILILVLDIIAFGFGLGAEQRGYKALVQADADGNYRWCSYEPDNIASTYGMIAFCCLLASQVIVMVASQCFCRGPPLSPGGSRACAIVLFIISWFTFLVSEFCLLAGSAKAVYKVENKDYNAEPLPVCESLKREAFAVGAAFTFLTAIISEVYYICYSNAAADSFTP